MTPQAFQPGELRDSTDAVIRNGTYGKRTPLVTADNMGILDYIMNNFDVVKNMAGEAIGPGELDELWEDN